MRLIRHMVGAILLISSAAVEAFEGDVHYGLTQWLALRAGFDQESAQTIATGNQRVDSGDMQFIDSVFMYACLRGDDVGANRAGAHHFPSAVMLPAAPELRAVSPGSEAAKKPVLGAIDVKPGQARFMLQKLGEALHTLQDSWAHQGIPDTPQPVEALFSCDPTRAWSHPKARGGWNSHKADLTMAWHADTVAMAKATYDVLLQYPMLSGIRRTPRDWSEIRPALDRFITASTKTEKKSWFVSQGISDVSFLEGVSLKDGAQPFEMRWPGRKLPPLASSQSQQHDVDAGLLDFYNRFFAKWVSTVDFNAVASEFGPDRVLPSIRGASGKYVSASPLEMAARLKVWRVRDHGRVAEIAHSIQPLTTRQRAALDTVGKEPNAYAHYPVPADAYFPLLPRGKSASPLLPFFIGKLRETGDKHERAIAVTKFRHLPYDMVGAVAEKIDGRWRVTSIVSVVDH
jgi:hypothetical protein